MGSSLTLQTVRSISDQLYDYALSAIYKSPWVYEPSMALAREPDIWELVRNEVHIASSIDRATKAVIRPWRIMPYDGSRDKPDNTLAAICKHGISTIDRFPRRRRRLAEARILGRTYGAIYWQKRRISLGGTPEMDWLIPYTIADIDRRRFHWVPDWNIANNEKTGVHLEFWNTNNYRWERIPQALRSSMIEYVYGDTEDRGGYGRGLMEPIYFAHYLLTITFEKISQGIDRWANGVWIGTVDGLRQASTGKTNTTVANTMQTVLNTMRSQHVAVIEKVDDIKVIETSGTGHQISMDFVHELVDAVERLLNGSVRPGGGNAGGTGARAQATVEENESESFFQEEREDLDAIIDRDVIGSFISVNRMNIDSLGLEKARRPKFTSEQIRKQDPAIAAQIMNEANKKVPLSRRQYYEKLELEEPLGDEDVIEVAPEGQAGFGDADFRDFGIKPKEKGTEPPKKAPNGEKNFGRSLLS